MTTTTTEPETAVAYPPPQFFLVRNIPIAIAAVCLARGLARKPRRDLSLVWMADKSLAVRIIRPLPGGELRIVRSFHREDTDATWHGYDPASIGEVGWGPTGQQHVALWAYRMKKVWAVVYQPCRVGGEEPYARLYRALWKRRLQSPFHPWPGLQLRHMLNRLEWKLNAPGLRDWTLDQLEEGMSKHPEKPLILVSSPEVRSRLAGRNKQWMRSALGHIEPGSGREKSM